MSEIIGETPLLKLERYANKLNLKADIFAKIEFLNPFGSVKDRAVKAMLDAAKARGLLFSGATVIEPTSGNTGIALAAFCAACGLKSVVVMPDGYSPERKKIILSYGGEVVLTDRERGMSGAIEKAEILARQIPNSFILGQFVSPANPAAHYKTTAPELWRDMNGKIDIFVAGVGSGGTLTGAGRYFKEKNPNIKIVAVEPEASPVLSDGRSGAHKIQGIGAGFVPETLDLSLFDEIIKVPDKEAFNSQKTLAETEGVFAGISSGAALWAAKVLSLRPENAEKNIITLFPDSGERYLSVL